MYINGFCDVDIAYSVPVGEAEGFVAYVGFYAFDASTGQGVQSGVHHGYSPGFCVVAMNFCSTFCQVYSHVAVVRVIVGEILFDNILLVSTADNEIIDAVMAVHFHDMPDDGFSAYFHHWFGNQVGSFAES